MYYQMTSAGTLVLMGAGASFGSLFVHPHLPSLGKQLFDELEKVQGVSAQLPDEIKTAFKSNYEAGMQALASYSSHDVVRFQKELGSYLFNFAPLPATYISNCSTYLIGTQQAFRHSITT